MALPQSHLSPIRIACFALAILAVSACSGQQHLPATVCNDLIDHWNKNVRAYTTYREQIKNFRNLVAETKPTSSATQIMVAKINPDIVDAVITQPAINAQTFESVPAVQLHLNDLKTDAATFATKVGNTKMANPDGSWGTVPVPGLDGAVNRLVGLSEAKPGVSATATFDAAFGAPLKRMGADYSAALSSMRQEYQSQCQGDPNEVRSLNDF